MRVKESSWELKRVKESSWELKRVKESSWELIEFTRDILISLYAIFSI
jgi:hypothetical protein